MGIEDLNEIMQSGGKVYHHMDTLDRRQTPREAPNSKEMTSRLDGIKQHIKALETKLDHTKQLIKTANQVT